MTKDEAMKLALEALEYIDLCDNDRDFLHPHECFQLDEAITAIKQSIAPQPALVQEPVAWYDPDMDSAYSAGDLDGEKVDGLVPLYTTPPAAQRTWVGLTDEEILKMAYPIRWQEVDDFEADKAVNFAQTIEAKLKEKNT